MARGTPSAIRANNPETAKWRHVLESAGWTFVRKTKHGFLYEKGTARLQVSGTPGDHRWMRNLISQIREGERRAAQGHI